MELSRNEADSQRYNAVPGFFQVRRRAAPRAQGPRVKGPFGAQGPFGAIGGYSEAIPSGWPLRADSHYEWRVILIGGRPGSEMRNGLK